MQTYSAVQIEFIKTILALFVLGVTWFVGQRILAYWEIKKKRKELEIATTTQFQQLYGEYKAVWRLWKIFYKEVSRKHDFAAPDHTRWELLQRAITAESGIEAIVMKLATERMLTASDIENLGLFRQGYQKLRQAIRDNTPLDYNYKSPEYILFNELASKVASLVSAGKQKKPPEPIKAYEHLTEIAKYRSEHWDNKVKEVQAIQAVGTT